jgi:hypothetical protein
LLPHDAVRIAQKWLREQGRTTNDQPVLNISLYKFDSRQNKWQYRIMFPLQPVMVLLDGSVVGTRAPGSNAVFSGMPAPRREPFVKTTLSGTNETYKTPVGMKGSYETVEAKVLKVLAVNDDGAKFRAYLVKWNDAEVVVSDPLAMTDKKAGDSITFMVHHSEIPQGDTKIKVLRFETFDFSRPPK